MKRLVKRVVADSRAQIVVDALKSISWISTIWEGTLITSAIEQAARIRESEAGGGVSERLRYNGVITFVTVKRLTAAMGLQIIANEETHRYDIVVNDERGLRI